MFEHVGHHRLGDYFRTVSGLLADGLFMNSGITRPQTVSDDAEAYFLRSELFPGGEFAHLSQVLRHAEDAPLRSWKWKAFAETTHERASSGSRAFSTTPTHALTVGENTWRVWLLYLAASVVNFEDGETDAYCMLMARRPSA
jgi:cyclopropane-fatty-acyl-phospholipid synthase